MIKYYYLLYTTDGIISLRPFDTKFDAEAYKEHFDKKVKESGRFLFSRIMKKDLSKYKDQFWL